MGSAGTAVYFSDSNKSINIEDTFHVYEAFNEFGILNSNSTVIWTGITINKLGTVSRGNFTNPDSATVTWLGCTYNDMGTFEFDATINPNTITSSIFRRCSMVTQDGATLSGCTFDNPFGTVALLVDDLSLVSKCTFIAAANHAVNLGTFSADASVTWDNTDTGYAAQGGTAAERTILCNVASGFTLTINRSASSSTPTYYNTGTGTVEIVQAVTLTIVSQVSLVGAEVRIYDLNDTPAGSLGTELSGVESHSSATYIYSGSGGNTIWIQIMLSGYIEFGQEIIMPSVDGSYTALLDADLNE
jgi:hypothetical protein